MEELHQGGSRFGATTRECSSELIKTKRERKKSEKRRTEDEPKLLSQTTDYRPKLLSNLEP